MGGVAIVTLLTLNHAPRTSQLMLLTNSSSPVSTFTD